MLTIQWQRTSSLQLQKDLSKRVTTLLFTHVRYTEINAVAVKFVLPYSPGEPASCQTVGVGRRSPKEGECPPATGEGPTSSHPPQDNNRVSLMVLIYDYSHIVCECVKTSHWWCSGWNGFGLIEHWLRAGYRPLKRKMLAMGRWIHPHGEPVESIWVSKHLCS